MSEPKPMPSYWALAEEVTHLHGQLDKLKAENAKLVDVLHEVETEAVHAFQCLQQDCVTATNSSEHFFEKWWHADCECERLAAENAKLRELVLARFACDSDSCESCADCRLSGSKPFRCVEVARELCVEVDG